MVITQIPPIWFDWTSESSFIVENCFVLGRIVRIVFVVIPHFRLSIENIIVEHVERHSVRSARRNKVQFMNSVSKKKFESVFHVTIELQRQSIEIQSFSPRIVSFLRTGSIRPPALSQSKPQEKSQAELEEEDALQLALSLSQSEAEERERQKKLLTQKYAKSTIQYPPIPIGSAPVAEETYWETQTKNDLITIKPFIPVRLSFIRYSPFDFL